MKATGWEKRLAFAAAGAALAALAVLPPAQAGQFRSATYGPKSETVNGHPVEYRFMAKEVGNPVGSPNVLTGECTAQAVGVNVEVFCWAKNQVTGQEHRLEVGTHGSGGGTVRGATLSTDEPYLMCMKVTVGQLSPVVGPTRCVSLT